jgi:hypothetical protein
VKSRLDEAMNDWETSHENLEILTQQLNES